MSNVRTPHLAKLPYPIVVVFAILTVRGSSLQRSGIREPGTIHVTAAHYQNVVVSCAGRACGSPLAWDGRS